MPRSPEQNQAVKDKRRGKLLDTSLKVFAIKGFGAVAIDDITNASRCSHGLFYHYFESKEDVFAAVWNEMIEATNAVPPLEAALAKGGTAGIKMISESYDKFKDADIRTLYAGSIAVRAYQAKGLPYDIYEKAKRYDLAGALAVLIAKAQEEGDAIAGDPAEISRAMALMIETELRLACAPRSEKKFTSGDVLFGMLMKKPLSEIDC